MLNEPFRILDNIPLIWCFASFETYQSRVLEIATQKRGLADAPQPKQRKLFFFFMSSLYSLVLCYVCPLIHFHTNFTQPLNLCICIPTCASAQESSCACVFREGEMKWEMKSEEGVRVIACSRDTWSLSGEEILGVERGLTGGRGAVEACHQFQLSP